MLFLFMQAAHYSSEVKIKKKKLKSDLLVAESGKQWQYLQFETDSNF